MKKCTLIWAIALLAVWGCGGSIDDAQATEELELASAESGLMSCGSGCPDGYYPASYSCTRSCGVSNLSCMGPSSPNAVTCQPIPATTFRQCGSQCPSGFVPQGYSCTPECSSGTLGSSVCIASHSPNAVTCQPIPATTFRQCGSQCPSGFVPQGYSCTPECSNGTLGSSVCIASHSPNAVTCQPIPATTFRQCGSQCPSGFVPQGYSCTPECSNGTLGSSVCTVSRSPNAVTCAKQ